LKSRGWLFSIFWMHLLVWPALAQEAQNAAGIPVTDTVTRNTCRACHAVDGQGRMTRISYIRATPEGWEIIIKRMVRLHGAKVSPEDARQIVKYLSDSHGLAREEAMPAFYESERRTVREKIPDEGLGKACTYCHSLGRVLSQRRAKEEWQLLVNMHMAFFPVTELAFRNIGDPLSSTGRSSIRPNPPALPDPSSSFALLRPGPIPVIGNNAPAAGGPDARDPVDRALDYLGRAQLLESPEWSAWRANFRRPRLEGTWQVEAYLPGKGRGYGQATIEAEKVEDEFRTRTTIEFMDGERIALTGRAILYAGYSWRGRSGDATARTEMFKGLREVMLLSSDLETLRGRWFTGSYDELGMEVFLRRAGQDIQVSGTDKPSLIVGKPATLKVYGSNFPADLTVRDVDLGPGIKVNTVRPSPTILTLDVSVANDAVPGYRDAVVRGKSARRVLAVFDRIDYLRVLPEHGMARLGGDPGPHPKGYQQFEAVAYHNGPDKTPGTADDIELGAVPVQWAIEEHIATLNDDDVRFVGSIDQKGFFTPNIEGPNPERRGNGNNYGDVNVVATYSGQGAERPVQARSRLIVTIPLYVIWQQQEVLPQR